MREKGTSAEMFNEAGDVGENTLLPDSETRKKILTHFSFLDFILLKAIFEILLLCSRHFSSDYYLCT